MQTKEDIMLLGFNENEALALLELFDFEFISDEHYENNDLSFDLSKKDSYEAILTLKNVKFSSELSSVYYVSLDEAIINKAENGYILTGKASYYDYENDKYSSFQLWITFESINLKYNALKVEFDLFEDKTPWDSLSAYASNIYEKIKQPSLDINEKEKSLSPLLKEFHRLYYNCLYKNIDDISFDTLKRYLPKSKKINILFENIIKSKDLEKQDKEIKNLFSYMSHKEFEDSWRSIFNLLNDSQAYYDNKNKPVLDKKVTDIHNHIDEVMHLNNYEGSYPLYKKITKIKGIHLKCIMDKMYFIGNDDTTIFIKCTDNIIGYYGTIDFEISTFVGNTDEVKDRYSCLFSNKGKGYIKKDAIHYEIDESGNIHFNENKAELKPNVICKKAEFKKLSKEERKIDRIPLTIEGIKFIILLWFGIGLFSGIILTLCFMLLEFIITLFMCQLSEFPQLFLETPWWKIFLSVWLGFGGIMSILTIFKK